MAKVRFRRAKVVHAAGAEQTVRETNRVLGGYVENLLTVAEEVSAESGSMAASEAIHLRAVADAYLTALNLLNTPVEADAGEGGEDG